MNEIPALLAAVKRLLKARGLSYRDLAKALDLSEPSVKRMLASGRLTLERLLQIGEVLGYSLAELAQEANVATPIRTLSAAQESELVSDHRLLLTAVCVLNQWGLADIISAYAMSEVECLQYLLQLDKLQLIDLLPGNRIRLKVARDFEWRPEGPIRQFFRTYVRDDFLGGSFNAEQESLIFLHGLLSAAAAQQLQLELQRVRRRFAELHAESAALPLAQKHSTSLLLANRYDWEPAAFMALRRQERQ